jgi:hypothetical protein
VTAATLAADPVTDWAADAHCREKPPGVDFFTVSPAEQRDIVARWCVPCLVRRECIAEAVSHGVSEIHGIWGDTPNRLKEIRKQRARERRASGR